MSRSPHHASAKRHDARSVAVGLAVAVLALVAGCGSGDDFTYNLTGAAPVCEAGQSGPTGRVTPVEYGLGLQSNVIRRQGDALWIVQSGSNSVARYNIETGSFDQHFIDVGDNRNPYDIAIAADEPRAYVTNYNSDSLTVATTQTGDRIDEYGSDGLDNPSGIALTDDYLYVTNIEYGVGNPFGPGHVTILDRDTGEVVGTKKTAAKNPQAARRIETPRGTRIAIVDAGSIDQSGGSPATAAGDGALELWKPNGNTSDDARTVHRLPVPGGNTRVGAPGRPAPTPDGRYLYFPSATAPVLFKFDLESNEWIRGTDDPIRVYESEGNSLHHAAIDSRGILYFSAFNEDAVYLVDTACDETLTGPIDVGRTRGLLEGPNSLAIWERGDDLRVYFNTSISNALGYIEASY